MYVCVMCVCVNLYIYIYIYMYGLVLYINSGGNSLQVSRRIHIHSFIHTHSIHTYIHTYAHIKAREGRNPQTIYPWKFSPPELSYIRPGFRIPFSRKWKPGPRMCSTCPRRWLKATLRYIYIYIHTYIHTYIYIYIYIYIISSALAVKSGIMYVCMYVCFRCAPCDD